jgi:hypothetical protein
MPDPTPSRAAGLVRRMVVPFAHNKLGSASLLLAGAGYATMAILPNQDQGFWIGLGIMALGAVFAIAALAAAKHGRAANRWVSIVGLICSGALVAVVAAGAVLILIVAGGAIVAIFKMVAAGWRDERQPDIYLVDQSVHLF